MKTIRLIALSLIFALLFSLPLYAAGDLQNSVVASVVTNNIQSDATVTVLTTTDVHGFVYPYDYNTNQAIDNSLAEAYTIIQSEQTTYKNNLLLDAGDTLQGTPLASFYNSIDTSWQTHPLFAVYDLMHYDAVCIGNHDFNFGKKLLEKARSGLRTPLLGANIIDSKTKTTWNQVAPYIIKRFETPKGVITVAVIGTVTPAIPNWENPGNYAGLTFVDQVPAARAVIDKLKGKVDAFILLSHSGVEINGAETIATENEIVRLTAACPEAALIIGGHKHQIWDESKTITDLNKQPLYINSIVNGVPYLSPGMFGKFVGEARLGFDKTASGWKVVSVNTKNIPVSGVAPDKKIVAFIQPYHDKVMKYLNASIGDAATTFPPCDFTADNPLVRLINQSMMYYGKADLSSSANFNKAATIPKGAITRNSMYSLYVYENYLYTIKITGAQLKKFLEYSARYINAAPVGATSFTVGGPANSIPSYNYDIVEGVTYTINAARPVGQRIEQLTFKNRPVQATDTFSFAMNNYRYNGGGGFMNAMGFDNDHPAEVLYDSQKQLGDEGQIRNLIMNYIILKKVITPQYEANPQIAAR
ncbi:MAG: 5'-nucleotidase C-terminal domain-containing protein [Bacillota bacterium]